MPATSSTIWSSSSKIRDQKDIISLLLKEFEENSSDWLWEFDRGGRFQRVSERFATAAEVSREQLVGLGFHDFLRSIGQDSDPILEELRHDIEKHATFSGVEVQISVAGGERFWRLTGKPTFDECGNYAGYIGMASDVTAEKNAGTAHQLPCPQRCADRASQPRQVHRAPETVRRAARTLRIAFRRCSTSISIGSRRSTTAAVT